MIVAEQISIDNVGTAARPRGRDRSPPARPRPRRINPHSDEAELKRNLSQLTLSAALSSCGYEGRAVDVMTCGEARIGYAADGVSIVRSARSGLAAAVVKECGHRVCACGCARRLARKNARKAGKRLDAVGATGANDARMITLTQPHHVGERAKVGRIRCNAALRILCRSKEWKDHVEGGILKIEIERSTPNKRARKAAEMMELARWHWGNGRPQKARESEAAAARLRGRLPDGTRSPDADASWWHVHVHGVVVGFFWKQPELLAHWRECLRRAEVEEYDHTEYVETIEGDRQLDAFEAPRKTKHAKKVMRKVRPHAVDDARVARGEIKAYGGARIERPRRGREGAIKEVTKYVTKPYSLAGMSIDDATDLVDALQGARMLRCVGSLYGLKLKEEAAPSSRAEGMDDLEEQERLENASPDDEDRARERAFDAIVGVTEDGREVARRDLIWRSDGAAQEQRRRILFELWEKHEQRRELRRAMKERGIEWSSATSPSGIRSPPPSAAPS